LIDLEQQFNAAKEEVNDLESMAYLDVSAEVDEKGKPVYSNEGLRKAAVRKLLKGNDEYQEAVASCGTAEKAYKTGRINVDYMNELAADFSRSSRALIARLEYFTAKMG